MITCGIHSTEVGANLVSMNIAHKLASDDSAETREILDKCIILLVPSLNPDGVDIVRDWYEKTLGTPAEGTGPPELYHHYTGHDNNRDWYAFTQVETQLTVDKVHNVWHPQIVHDIHQQGESGTRFFLPPYVEPWEPNVPPLIQAGVNFMGSAMAWEMIAEGKTGRGHKRGLRRVDARARLPTLSRRDSHIERDGIGATRVAHDACSLTDRRRRSTSTRSAEAGITRSSGRAASGSLRTSSIISSRARSRSCATRRATASDGCATSIRSAKMPCASASPASRSPFSFLRRSRAHGCDWQVEGLARMEAILKRGGVEIITAAYPFNAEGANYPAGTKVILIAQPYGAFAKTLLERQQYPDLREYPGGPPRRPYDVTAHTLPLLMGVNVVQVDYALHAAAQSSDGSAAQAKSRQAVGQASTSAAPRLGLYKSFAASMDEGWTRWIFTQYQRPVDACDRRRDSRRKSQGQI